MPADYRIDPDARLIRSNATGVVTDDDLRDHQKRLRGDPAFDPRFDQLWDFRAAEVVEVTTAVVHELAGSRSFEAGAKRALVAPTDVGFGLARMFQTLHEAAPEELRVFRTLDDAKAWLGLP
jgi:hypothetical protein